MPRIEFQVGEEEKAAFVRAAHRAETNLSDWMRRVLLAASDDGGSPVPAPPRPKRPKPLAKVAIPQPVHALAIAEPKAFDKWVCPCGQANLWRDSCSRCNEPRSDR